MKKIEAIIRKERFDEVNKRLQSSGIGGFNFFQGQGVGMQRSTHQDIMRIEVYVDEFQVDLIIDLIKEGARTGSRGDGKIAVIDLENLYRIRTDDEGVSAI